MADMQDFAGVVALAIKAAMAPVLERVAQMEAKVTALASVDGALTDLRERIVVAETKAAALVPVDVSPLRQQMSELEVKSARSEDVHALTLRLAAVEAKPEPVTVSSTDADIEALRVRVMALESRSAEPNPWGAVIERTERTIGELTKDFGAMRERVAVVEVRQPIPGPAGKDGMAGRDGVDGVGFDDMEFETDERGRVWIKASRGDKIKRARLTGCTPRPFLDGTEYLLGDKSVRDGSEWTALKDEPTGRPGDGPSDATGWLLTTKRGKDGRDLRDAKDAPPLPVVSVGGPRG